MAVIFDIFTRHRLASGEIEGGSSLGSFVIWTLVAVGHLLLIVPRKFHASGSKVFLQLVPRLHEVAARGAFGDLQRIADFFVRVALYDIQVEHRAVGRAEFLHCGQYLLLGEVAERVGVVVGVLRARGSVSG